MFGFGKKKKSSGSLGPIEAALINGRGFAAAEVSATLGPWTFDGGFSNSEIGSSLSTVRARSRDMSKNSEYFARWLALSVANIVGDQGFRLKSLAEKSEIDVAVDEEAAYFIETHWAKWAKNSALVDSAEVLDLAGICRLAVENWMRDGEAFILINRAAQNRYGLSLRLVRPDCCDETLNYKLDSRRVVRLGVEFDAETGKRLAYYFDANRDDENAHYFANGKSYVRIPAEDVIHLYSPHDATQVRGFPMGHASLKKLKMLDEFDNAELVAARDEVNTLGIFKAPAGREQEIGSLAKDERVRNRLEAPSEPGQKIILKQGWDYAAIHPNHPNAGLPAFKVSMLRDIASGFNVEFANFANDWAGVSYSSVRAGTLSERDHWMICQAVVINRVMTPIYKAWLTSFLSLRVSGNYTYLDYNRLLAHEFRGRRWAWVDPMKDVQAAKIAVDNGWKTDAEVASDFGGDIDDNIDEAKRVRPKKKEAGLLPVADEFNNNANNEEE